ncbi:MAG: exonuclease domain-containing protein [Actinomycetota bacterium]|jgi:DNA polymerase-3 subunit epsilon|nr:exonuclease domain-containing protein [Actinomycetota bacterium]
MNRARGGDVVDVGRATPPAAPALPVGGFAVVDVETTGFSPERDRVVELAVVVLAADGEVLSCFATLLDPGRDPGPTHVHGITADMLVGAPSFADVQPYLAHLLSGRVLVGHNVGRFDLAFLAAECTRAGAGTPPSPVELVDTLRVARQRLDLRGQASLADCCDRFGLVWEDHHSALGDALATASLLGAMRRAVGDGELDLPAALVRAAANRWPGARDAVPPVRLRPGTRTGARVLTG